MGLYASEDRIARLLREKTIARGFAVFTFLALLYLFRHLWPVFVSFVLFERGLGYVSRKIAAVMRVPRAWVIGGITALLLGGLVLLAYSSYDPVANLVDELIESLPRWQKQVRNHELFHRIQRTFRDSDTLAEHVESYATAALSMVTTIGRFFVEATVGFLLALVYLFEESKLDEFSDGIAPKSLFGRLLRWSGHVADAIAVTVQLQLVVAVFNTVTTLPVLLVLGVPNVPALMALVFVAALIPVLGNLVAGAVLCVFAYQAKGVFGVAIFLGVTALLGKVESYYLSPRLTARHVKMPSFILVASLVLFEQLFGFAGFFLSFPFLFVAGRIRAEFREEDGILPPRSINPRFALRDEDGPEATPIVVTSSSRASTPPSGDALTSTQPVPAMNLTAEGTRSKSQPPIPLKTLQSEVHKE